MFLDSNTFPFVPVLESNFDVIASEFLSLGDHEAIVPFPQPEVYSPKAWDIFPLYALGKKVHEGCEECPETTKIVESIPGMWSAFFSILRAGSFIGEHQDGGYADYTYRCHFGLVTPEGAHFTVDRDTRPWQAGRCLIFDANNPHQAVNQSDTDRIVLIVDVNKQIGTPIPEPCFDPNEYLKSLRR
jgi:aspartyl/asparaginyl beta-hydroxylase (cupin superfamily)